MKVFLRGANGYYLRWEDMRVLKEPNAELPAPIYDDGRYLVLDDAEADSYFANAPVEETTAPTFSVQPAISPISPTTGQTITLNLGAAGPNATLQVSMLRLNGVDKMSELNGLFWDTTGETAGTVAFQVSATNSVGTTLSDVISIQLIDALTAPVFSAQPTLSPSNPQAGDVISLNLGAAGPQATLEIETFTLAGVSKVSELTGANWDSTGEAAGTISLRVRATNAVGTTLSNIITTELVEPTQSLPAPTYTVQPSMTPVSPEVGDVVMLNLGSAGPSATITIEKFELATVSKVSELSGLNWSSAGEAPGTLVLQTRATNATGFVLSDEISITLAAQPVSAPTFTTQPSISPQSGFIDSTFTLTLGAAGPDATLSIEYFRLDGVSKVSELSGLTWDSTGEAAGTITYRVRATNSGGFTLSDEITATITEVTGIARAQAVSLGSYWAIHDPANAFGDAAKTTLALADNRLAAIDDTWGTNDFVQSGNLTSYAPDFKLSGGVGFANFLGASSTYRSLKAETMIGASRLMTDSFDRFSTFVLFRVPVSAVNIDGAIFAKAGSTANGDNRQFQIGMSGDKRMAITLRGATTYSVNQYADGLWHVACVSWDGTTATLEIDNTELVTLAVGTTAEEATQQVIFGGRNGGNSQNFDNDIGSIFACDHALTRQNRQEIAAALAAFYGRTLSVTATDGYPAAGGGAAPAPLTNATTPGGQSSFTTTTNILGVTA